MDVNALGVLQVGEAGLFLFVTFTIEFVSVCTKFVGPFQDSVLDSVRNKLVKYDKLQKLGAVGNATELYPSRTFAGQGPLPL